VAKTHLHNDNETGLLPLLQRLFFGKTNNNFFLENFALTSHILTETFKL